jgi:M6 family metalloprotease-like protein
MRNDRTERRQRYGWLTVMAVLLAFILAPAPQATAAPQAHRDPTLDLVSDVARGTQRYLVILVNFPDVQPRLPLKQVRERATVRLAQWYQSASNGQTRFVANVKGPYTLPRPLDTYKVSPYNFKVESRRVYALVRDALSLAEADGTDLNNFDVVAVILRCFTLPGRGYGMMCYCANPGMLSKVRYGRAKYVPITTRQGTEFRKGVVVMVENFHQGFLAHDLAHAIGGVYDGRRLVGDLYDFEAQSRPRRKFDITDAPIYLGPWDIMSQHFITRNQPPPGFSLYTKMRLGYVRPDQIRLVRPGKTVLVKLSALAANGDKVGIKIPLSAQTYFLVENRQPLKVDRILPASGVMIYKVDESREEGSGQVRAQNADPGAPNFSRAPFGTDGQARIAWVVQQAGVAVVPILKQGQDYLVLVTDTAQAEAAQRVAQKLMQLRGSPALQAKLPQVLQLLRAGRLAAAAEAIQP